MTIQQSVNSFCLVLWLLALTPSAPLALMPPPSSGGSQASTVSRLQMQLHLHDLQQNATDLRKQLTQLRKMQVTRSAQPPAHLDTQQLALYEYPVKRHVINHFCECLSPPYGGFQKHGMSRQFVTWFLLGSIYIAL